MYHRLFCVSHTRHGGFRVVRGLFFCSLSSFLLITFLFFFLFVMCVRNTNIYKYHNPKLRMATIIQIQEERRRNKIAHITASIKKAFDADREIDYDKLIGVCCIEFGASRRHVMELIDIALSQLNHVIEKTDGRRVIKNKGPVETDSKQLPSE